MQFNVYLFPGLPIKIWEKKNCDYLNMWCHHPYGLLLDPLHDQYLWIILQLQPLPN